MIISHEFKKAGSESDRKPPGLQNDAPFKSLEHPHNILAAMHNSLELCLVLSLTYFKPLS